MPVRQFSNRMVDLIQLRYFVAVAATENYTTAAAHLSVEQTVVWKQVRNLQNTLGLDLFERVGRGVRLTAAGRDLLFHARAVVAAAQTFEKQAQDVRDGRAGTVRVACFPVHIVFLFADVISTFQPAHPQIEIDLSRVRDDRSALGRSPFDDLAAGDVDLAVGPARREQFDGIKLYDVRYVAVFPDTHQLRTKRCIQIKHLATEPLLLTPRGNHSREQIEAACVAAGMRPLVRASSGSAAALLALGAQGVGIPIVADDNLPANGSPYPIVIDGKHELGAEIWLHWRKGLPLSPQVEAFVDHIVAAIGDSSAQRFPSLAAYS